MSHGGGICCCACSLLPAAGGHSQGLRYAHAGKKGFLLVTLSKDNHHSEYIHVSTICSPSYTAECEYAYDW